MVQQLNCFMCSNLVPGWLDGLAKHLKFNHGITVGRGLPDTGFICSQNGCQRSFVHFYDLRKHIRTTHSHMNYRELQDNLIDHSNVLDDQPPSMNHEFVNTNTEDNVLQKNVQAEIDVNEDPMEDDLKRFVIGMIGRLKCNGSVTGSVMSNFIQEFQEVIFYLQNKLKKDILSKMKLGEVVDEHLINEVITILEFKNPFMNVYSEEEQINAVMENFGYVQPQEIPLGIREDTTLDKASSTYVHSQIVETFHYVSIINVLKLVLNNKNVRHVIDLEQPSTDNILSSFIDGVHFKTHPFFQKHKHAIRIKLYYDELEIVNPLGSKTGVHKLAVFYYEIDNLPPQMNSELSSIHVLLICSHANLLRFGFEKVLEPFIIELNKLESEVGVIIDYDGEEYIIRGSLMAFCGDGLAVHEIYNHLGPSANKFCRMCMYTRQSLHAGSLEKAECRTKQLYDQHLELLRRTRNADASKSSTGIKGNAINGVSFLELTQEDFLFMNIKLGPAKEFLKIIEREKRKNTDVLEGVFEVGQDGRLIKLDYNVNNADLTPPPCKRMKLTEEKELDSAVLVDNSEDGALINETILNLAESSLSSSSEEDSTIDTFTTTTLKKPTSDKKRSSRCTSKVTPIQKLESAEEVPHSSKDNYSTLMEKTKFTRFESVEKTLLNHKQGKRLVLAARNILVQKDRKLLVRILMSELVATHNNNYYPPSQALEALAKALVTEFPKLSDPMTENGCHSYHDPKTGLGFFQYRLMTMRTHLDPSLKKYKTSAKKECIAGASKHISLCHNFSEDQLLEKISLLKFTYPSKENKAAILNGMAEIFSARRNWILNDAPNVANIIDRYPRLVDFHGSMIDADFKEIFPDKYNNFMTKFVPHYVQRILSYATLSKPSLVENYTHIQDENLKAILLLINLLPVSNACRKGKNSKKQIAIGMTAEQYVIEFISEVESIENFAAEKRKRFCSSVQPYICAINSRIMQFKVQVDGCILQRKVASEFITAFDLLFKTYYIFDLEYPILLKNFFLFIQIYIYDIPGALPNIVSSVYVSIMQASNNE